jgi:hypothetical protein
MPCSRLSVNLMSSLPGDPQSFWRNRFTLAQPLAPIGKPSAAPPFLPAAVTEGWHA